MPSNSLLSVLLTPQFKKDLKQLAKRYRSIREDLDPQIERLKSGELTGDPVVGFSHAVFKLRIKNSDIKKGKSSGYRIIYYMKTDTSIVLITIYSKSDQADISNKVIENIINNFEENA